MSTQNGESHWKSFQMTDQLLRNAVEDGRQYGFRPPKKPNRKSLTDGKSIVLPSTCLTTIRKGKVEKSGKTYF